MPAQIAIKKTYRKCWDWPTLAIAFVIYVGLGMLMWQFESLSLWVSLPIGAWLIAWHNSLQHETIHQHPTPYAWLNYAIGWSPLSLWLPYALYQRSHRAHHQATHLTDPDNDPESFYWTPQQWQALPHWLRTLYHVNATLAGRLIIGPALMVVRFYIAEWHRSRQKDFADHGIYLRHFVAVALLLFCVHELAGVSLWLFIFGIIYPGLALGLLRSYAEHLQEHGSKGHTAIIHAHPLWALLFLRNNLHVLHHTHPHLPWYRLRWKDNYPVTSSLIFNGYGEIMRRYFFKPISSPIFTGEAASQAQSNTHTESNR